MRPYKQHSKESTDNEVKLSALAFFKALFIKGHGFEQAIAAQQGIQSDNYSLRESAFYLFKALLEKGPFSEELIQHAQQAAEEINKRDIFSNKGDQLLKLVEQKKS
jgi:hypothetical protein